MKVLFISRATLFTDKGGDTVQLVNTAAGLRQLGVQVDVRLSQERIDYAPYDLIHFFNIIRPADILVHMEQSGKPFVVSTIYVDYSEYEKKVRGGLMGLAFRLASPDLIEYAKVIARALLKKEKIASRSYLWLGQRRSIRKIITQSKMLLPNSHSEYRRLARDYGVEHAYRAIPNAIDPALFPLEPHPKEKDPHLVLCVGRIEGRKNQLSLIRALKDTNYRLLIIGSAAANQAGYFQACKEEAGNNVQFINNIPQEQLLDYYRAAKVHVLASWFETTGLSSLEAAAMGCQVVVTRKGDTEEYFEDLAFYCDPASVESIKDAVDRASLAVDPESLQNRIRSRYTWDITARETLEAYKTALS